ncbi:efflux RND transporter periplasmic adaptor subunit [Methylomonas koyamae]|uniref:efflux RND transporter periplasmic adaptor subunit n=1 Tax=Methylomonas koyamae TaxID=702114 RepID=UPI002873CD63|nr:efflux RND transporter periplasmic adaptor subunit [Methylomonas koyamae]WNB77947.1 efflux RND transporter periplasmic adaptor subunit [Methylomonas koyamae]
MIKRILWVVLFTVLLLGGLFGLKFRQINQAIEHMQPPPPAVVALAEVRREQWPAKIASVGSLRAVAGINLSNEVAGQIKAIHFQSGQSVKQGQLLLELDSATDQAELKGLEAELRLAELHYQRSAQMLEKKFVSQADYDQNLALVDKAKAAVAAKQSVIAKKQIKAPFDGEIGIRQVDLGQYLAEGSAIVNLEKLDPIYLDFSLPERQLGLLGNGQQVEINVAAYPERRFSGTITALSPAVDLGSRAVNIQAKFNNAQKLLRPGMFAQVAINSGKSSDVLTVPDTAVTYNPYGDSVFLAVTAGNGLTVQSRQVRTGQSRGGRVEILEGLQAGDRVVSAGQLKLRNGMPITADSQPAPGEREAAQ